MSKVKGHCRSIDGGRSFKVGGQEWWSGAVPPVRFRGKDAGRESAALLFVKICNMKFKKKKNL